MDLLAFRIKNFRSITDTKWTDFSTDNVTALVGQNESGKTSVLDALAASFSNLNWNSDDQRHDEKTPEMWIRARYSDEEIVKASIEIEDDLLRKSYVSILIESAKNVVTYYFSSAPDINDSKILNVIFNIESPNLYATLKDKAMYYLKELGEPISEDDKKSREEYLINLDKLIEIATAQIETNLFACSPKFVVFNEEFGLLPDQIEISDDHKLYGDGITAAKNYLSIAGIDLKELVTANNKSRATTLGKANIKLTTEFLEFWRQTIGEKNGIELQCDIHIHPAGHERVGKPYLEFLICDNSTTLYPKQRSRGTRWFISFFLQLKASSLLGKNNIFLLDEPGANLHEKAQSDVLALIEKIKDKTGVIYSTHSPHLISYDSLHRILAIERDANDPNHPTKVISAHALGSASIDTLSPIFTTMGVALSRQTAIKQRNNVILEELSGYYYLKAFWLLTKSMQEVHFLAATGASNIPQLAQLFLGWGLEFIIAIDDESTGRRVFNSLKTKMFSDNHEWASRRIYKISKCDGIEDIFTVDDYKKFVISRKDADITSKNSEWAKKNHVAKAIDALNFLQEVESEKIVLEMFEVTTQKKIQDTVHEISARLQDYQVANPELDA